MHHAIHVLIVEKSRLLVLIDQNEKGIDLHGPNEYNVTEMDKARKKFAEVEEALHVLSNHTS